MNDVDAIAELLQQYGSRFDARDSNGFSELFTDDAVVIAPGGHEIIGRDRLVKMVARTPPGGQHVVAHPEIEIQNDEATSTTRFSATLADGSDTAGRYENTFVRTPDGWRISRHVIVPDAT